MTRHPRHLQLQPAAAVAGDLGAKLLEEASHGDDVGEGGHVLQDHRLGGEQARRHGGKRRVLGRACFHHALEAYPALDLEPHRHQQLIRWVAAPVRDTCAGGAAQQPSM